MRVVIALAALLSATTAAAQEISAAPGSIAYGTIEQANAKGVFELVHNGQVSVRHIGSGMRCDFARDGEGGSLRLDPGAPRGDAVTCESVEGPVRIVQSARRARPGTSLALELEAALLDLGGTGGETRHAAQIESTPAARGFAGFLVPRDGVRTYLGVGVALVSDWVIIVHNEAPAPNPAAEAAGREMTRLVLDAVLLEMQDAPR